MKTVLNRSILNGIARMRVRLIALDELFQTVPCSFESDQALASFSKNAFLQGVVVLEDREEGSKLPWKTFEEG